MKLFLFVAIITFAFFLSCNLSNNDKQQNFSEVKSRKMDSLIKFSKPGDLLVRLGDDVTSLLIKQLNQIDKQYTHAGIVVSKDGKKMVCHILPTMKTNKNDTILYENISDFFDTVHNAKGAWYRYDLNEKEIESFCNNLNDYHSKKVSFDIYYDTLSDDKLYCSEMIAKAIKASTNSRILININAVKDLPQRARYTMVQYFKALGNNNLDSVQKVVDSRVYYPIDVLYLNKNCSKILEIDLKKFN